MPIPSMPTCWLSSKARDGAGPGLRSRYAAFSVSSNDPGLRRPLISAMIRCAACRVLSCIARLLVRSWWRLPVLHRSAAPGGAADHAAEVAAMEVQLLVGDHIGLDVAEGRLRLVLDAVVERLDDVFLEMLGAWMGAHHGLALGVAVFGIG